GDLEYPMEEPLPLLGCQDLRILDPGNCPEALRHRGENDGGCENRARQAAAANLIHACDQHHARVVESTLVFASRRRLSLLSFRCRLGCDVTLGRGIRAPFARQYMNRPRALRWISHIPVIVSGWIHRLSRQTRFS